MSMSLFAKKLATENCDWLDFVRAVYVCQKLELAIQRYASPTIIQYIQSISSDVENIDIFKGMRTVCVSYLACIALAIRFICFLQISMS